MQKQTQIYKGSCHCKAVTFEVISQSPIVVWICNCTICKMRKNYHFIIPSKNIIKITGEQNLSTYTFNTHTAKHKFCKICGITPFYIPRSNPDGLAITLDCVYQECYPKNIEYRQYDGKNWQKFYDASNIKHFSQI